MTNKSKDVPPTDLGGSFSPREFLRQRKPEAFSDSSLNEESTLTRPFLEHYFDKLTNRSQETAFENFARKLAQREICPNLLPHTGPTGGGDSKVDTETYPVAEKLALAWFYGFGSHDQRWAFAFSAKKQWRAKVKSDIAKLVDTGRGYTDAFFISSRFIRDKDRSDLEDELAREHQIRVHIHDVNWILDRIFETHRHYDLLLSEFGLHEAATVRRVGERDRDREQDLAAIEESITVAAREGTITPDVVDECVIAVRLSRALERPREEVDGKLARAARIAKQYGTPHQKMMAAYENAWTSFWYYDDSQPLLDAYGSVEKQALQTQNSADLELLSNLWLLLRTAVSRGWVTKKTAKLTRRTGTLRSALEALAADAARPSGALHAKTMILQLKLVTVPREQAGSLLLEIRDMLRESEGHLGYPLMKIIGHMLRFEEFLSDVPEYDELYAAMAEISGRREGETTEAIMFLERGQRHIQAKRFVEAIRAFGRVLTHLYTDETRDEAAVAFLLCGFAYERIGLLWAARAATLQAANIASADFFNRREVTWLQSAGYNRMKWLELQLGRLPSMLAWHEADITIRSVLEQQNQKTPAVEPDRLFDQIAAILVLKAEREQFSRLTHLPDVLDALGLFVTASAIRYLLGHDPELPNVGLLEAETLFRRLASQPAAAQVASLSLDPFGKMDGRVLGCKLEVHTDGSRSAAHFAEAVLAGVESFMSTAAPNEAIADARSASFDVRYVSTVEPVAEYSIEERLGLAHMRVATRVNTEEGLPAASQHELHQVLSDFFIHVCARIFHFRDAEDTFTRFFRDERVLSRAASFAVTYIAERNILGRTPKDTIESWNQPSARTYAVLRTCSPIAKEAAASVKVVAETADDSDTRELRSHADLENVSLIRKGLWQRAGWFGTAFFMDPDLTVPPTLALLFRDGATALEIFEAWLEELGGDDPDDRLRVSLVRGVDVENPYAYSLSVGTNLSASEANKRLMSFGLACRMDADSDLHLTNFLSRYERVGEYELVPAIRDGSEASIVGDARLRKRNLHVRRAWEIGINDPDAGTIRPEDQVIIPESVETAPVLELQEWLRNL